MDVKGIETGVKKDMSKWYVVYRGRQPGIYRTWEECAKQVSGYSRAQYESFRSHVDAVAAFREKLGNKADSYLTGEDIKLEQPVEIILPSVSVGALCLGSLGAGQYRIVCNESREVICESKVYKQATDPALKFLGIVEALKIGNQVVYSDSDAAVSWVLERRPYVNKKISQDLEKDMMTAMMWLAENEVSCANVLMWPRDAGYIPAAFSRQHARLLKAHQERQVE